MSAREETQDAGEEMDAAPCGEPDTVGHVSGLVGTTVDRLGVDGGGHDAVTLSYGLGFGFVGQRALVAYLEFWLPFYHHLMIGEIH